MRLHQRKVAEEQERSDKLSRLARARANTPTPESLAEAREYFQKQKREAATEVKSSVVKWEAARKADADRRFERAKSNHSVVYATRNEASKNRAEIKEARHVLAQQIRQSLRDMESERKGKIENVKQSIVETHRQNFERKFVTEEATQRAESSEYTRLVQRMRHPALSSSSASTGSPMQESSASDKSPASGGNLPAAWADFVTRPSAV